MSHDGSYTKEILGRGCRPPSAHRSLAACLLICVVKRCSRLQARRRLQQWSTSTFVCVCSCVYIHVCLCSCICMDWEGEMAVLVVSIKLPNYLIVPCCYTDHDNIDSNCLRLLCMYVCMYVRVFIVCTLLHISNTNTYSVHG